VAFADDFGKSGWHVIRRHARDFGYSASQPTRSNFDIHRGMSSDFHFGPARLGEQTVYGARAPDASPHGISEWSEFMREQGITRVCCLLDQAQLAAFPVSLEGAYKKRFGSDRILVWPVTDHHLCPRWELARIILPFLRAGELAGERVVVHCWGGNGRAGHVLAAWLVAARGVDPRAALAAVEAAGRLPQEAVLTGTATMDELIELLASCQPFLPIP
jgi:protein-tyrosine phosphatase